MTLVAFTGIKPTGRLHLGNYFGAIKWVVDNQGEERYSRLLCIADLHALTSKAKPTDPIILASELLACGIKPEKTIIFKQSDVLEHASLMWMLSRFCTTKTLEKLAHWKERSIELGYNAAFFCYPLLQASDILLYRSNIVPVGKDQSQHIELTRTIAGRINSYYKQKIFEVPEGIFCPERIKSLRDPLKKMSKSSGESSCIFLTDSQSTVEQKIMKAKTDSLSPISSDLGARPELSALFSLLVQTSEAEKAATNWAGYRELKEQVSYAVNTYLEPIRERFDFWTEKRNEVQEILCQGAKQAKKIAACNIQHFKSILL